MNTLFVDTLEIAVPMSILIGVLLLISPFIKKSYVAKWRYFMWMFVAVRLILPFKISMLSAPITMEFPNQVSGMPVASETIINSVPYAARTANMSLQSILMMVWIMGIAVFAVYQIINYFSFKRMVKRWSVNVTNTETIRLFDEIKESLGERRRLGFKICKTVSTPMVVGFIKPMLLLPDDNYTKRELRVILHHELVHFKRNDIWYKLVLVTANAINWFNPLIYMMVNAANKDIELACDAEVVKEKDMEFRREYCRAILTVVHNKQSMVTSLSTCFIISKKVIQERFRDILDLKKKRKGIVMFAVVALSVAVSGSLVTFATEKAADVLEEDLNIVERPTPKPKPAATPEMPVSAEETVRNVEDTTVKVQEDIPIVNDDNAYTPEQTAEPEPEPTEIPSVSEVSEKQFVDLSQQSNMIDIRFNEAGEVFTSSSTFKAEQDTSMVVVSTGDCKVQIVDNTTGEIVQEQEMTEGNNSIILPVEDRGEYSINAVATQEDSNTSLYVYGK